MKKTLSRNIAIVSAIFAVTFSIMLATNYFQVSSSNTASLEMVETLKQSNDENSNNPQLQEQIRELDLLARKAYFINLGRLKMGVVILLVMMVVFVISLQIYFANSKNIPDKEIAPIDEWIIKTKTRRYLVWTAGILTLCGIIFAVLTSPYLKKPEIEQSIADENPVEPDADFLLSDFDTETSDADVETQCIASLPSSPPQETEQPEIEISKITHNGFRGNNSLGVSHAKNVPTAWNLSSGKNILWKIKTPRKGYNSPVINGNKLFFTGADDEARELYCYELSSGKELWTLTVKNIPGSPTQMPKTTDDTGLAASTVATNGKQVCAIFATGDLICADMEGKQLWAKNLGIPDNHYGYASSLLIFGNLLIIQYDNRNAPRVIALDLTTGNQRWMKERQDKITWSSPIIAQVNNTPQLILMGNPGITSYNPNTGEQNWRVECMTGEIGASPAFSNGIVYGATEYATLIAINATDGSTLWKNNEFLPEVSSPVATKDFVFVATTYGVVATYDAQTGEIIQSMELNAEFYASPIIVEGKVYLISADGKIFIFSAKSDFKLITSFETGEQTFATPAFTDKKIVIRTEKSVYCVSALP